MRDRLAVCMAAAAIAAAACSDQLGPSRRLIPNLGAVADSSTDSTPGRRPGPVASVTVSPESATVAVGDSVGFFADLRDAAGNPARDANLKWSVADPSVARIEGEFGQSLILRALRRGSTMLTARSHGKNGTALLVVDSLPPPPPRDSTPPPPPPPPGDSVATVSVSPDTALAAVGEGKRGSGRLLVR